MLAERAVPTAGRLAERAVPTAGRTLQSTSCAFGGKQIFVKDIDGDKRSCCMIHATPFGTLPRHVPLQSVDSTVVCHFLVLRHLRRVGTGSDSSCLCRQNWNDTEKLSMARSWFPHNRKCFLNFLFFRFLDLPGRKSTSGPKLRSSPGSLSKLFARKPFRLCPESECV